MVKVEPENWICLLGRKYRKEKSFFQNFEFFVKNLVLFLSFMEVKERGQPRALLLVKK